MPQPFVCYAAIVRHSNKLDRQTHGDTLAGTKKAMPDIQNSQALTTIFGEWPSFHDAEVVSISLNRHFRKGASLEATIHLWQMTSEVDAKGYFVSKNSTLTVLRFDDIVLELLEGFNHQNVLSELLISEIAPAAEGNAGCEYEVVFNPSFGCGAVFNCRSIQVISAEACAPPV